MVDGYKYLSSNRYDSTFLATSFGNSAKLFCIVATGFIFDSGMCNLYKTGLEVDAGF